MTDSSIAPTQICGHHAYVLIHPLTDAPVDDHSRYALWLGTPVALKLETLRRAYRSELLPTA